MSAFRHCRISVVLFAIALTVASPSFAVQPDEILSDPALESRARALSRELRCMVCQNQSIDDSEAPLARDLRLLVRERIAAGDSNAQVIDFLVARYGEFVLLNEGDPYIRVGNDASGRTGIDMGVSGAPETFVVDKAGKVRYRHVGAISIEDWEQKIGPLMEKLKAES